MYSKDDKVGMGRKGSTPAGEEFMPGTSAKELKDLAKREMDALTAKKYTAAYHRKRGLSFKAIGAILLASYCSPHIQDPILADPLSTCTDLAGHIPRPP